MPTSIKHWTLSFTHPETSEQQNIPATVPGNIAADLMGCGILPDLYFGRNVMLARRWELTDFNYKAAFMPRSCSRSRRITYGRILVKLRLKP